MKSHDEKRRLMDAVMDSVLSGSYKTLNTWFLHFSISLDVSDIRYCNLICKNRLVGYSVQCQASV